MSTQFLSVLLIAAAPLGRPKAEEPVNPYQNAKVGDYAVYTMATKVAGINIDGTMTQTVTAKDDKTVTVETVTKMNGTDVPAQSQVIDLTRPFDPTQLGAMPPGMGATLEKLKDGTEKLKVGAKEYETKWESYKLKVNGAGAGIDAEVKVWQGKGLAIPLVKMEMSADVAGSRMEMTMSLTEVGNNGPDKTGLKK